MNRINPLAKPNSAVASETAAEEVAFERAHLGQLQLVEVSCGEFGRDVRALADLNQRIVIPKTKN